MGAIFPLLRVQVLALVETPPLELRVGENYGDRIFIEKM